MSPSERLHGLDALRALAMLLGIILHASIPYKAGYQLNLWVIDADYQSYLFDWIYLSINSFRMPLFFLLAGLFASILISKKGLDYFATNRFKRLVVPFVLSYLFILPITLLPYLYYFHQETSFIQYAFSFISDFYLFRQKTGLMHLWFLYYLIIFSAILYSICFFHPLLPNVFKELRSIKTENTFLFFLLGIAMVSFTVQFFKTPIPSIWAGFKLSITQFIYFGLFFLMGVLLNVNRILLLKFSSFYNIMLLIGAMLSVLNVYLLNTIPEMDNQTLALFKVSFSTQTILMVFGLIGLFNKKMNTAGSIWIYISRSSYWIYLIHLPLVLGLQLLLLDSFVPPWMRFYCVLIGTLSIAFFTYQILVHNTFIGKILNGHHSKNQVSG